MTPSGSPGYVLDTDTLSHALAGVHYRVVHRRLNVLRTEERATTAVTAAELLYGARRRPARVRLPAVRELLDRLEVLPFDLDAAEEYAALRANLETRGQPLEEADLRIAAIALATGRTLVTGNVRHFERVPNLRVESWLAEDSGSEVQP